MVYVILDYYKPHIKSFTELDLFAVPFFWKRKFLSTFAKPDYADLRHFATRLLIHVCNMRSLTNRQQSKVIIRLSNGVGWDHIVGKHLFGYIIV